jgi:uncharacterized membrane protein
MEYLFASIVGAQEVKQSIIFGVRLISSSILLANEITPELLSRTKEQLSAILVANMLGIAGGLALITAIPEIIVGVAIAVALVPSATVTGIGIGLGYIDIAVSAF